MDLLLGHAQRQQAVVDGGDHVVQTADEITLFFEFGNKVLDFLLHIAAFALPIRVAAQGEQELEIRVLGGQVFPFLAVDDVGLVAVAVDQVEVFLKFR